MTKPRWYVNQSQSGRFYCAPCLQKIGRKLAPGEHVHHTNQIKTDNRPENLQVMSQQAHRKLHNDQIAEKLARLADYEQRYGPLETDRAIAPQPAANDPLRDLKTEGVH